MDDILELARWAPSGDNTQPWRFEVIHETRLVVHAFDTRGHCVYDLDGRPSQLSVGALVETLAIAASTHGLRMHWSRAADSPPERPRLDIRFEADPLLSPDPLFAAVRSRSVQRRPYATTALTGEQRAALAQAVGPGYGVRWIEGAGARLAMARLLFRSAWLRLATPEAYRVHREVIAWRSRFSDDRIPDQALGVGAPMLALMRFVLKSWRRVTFFNRFLAGTWAPRIQMDFAPAWACGAHFVLTAAEQPRDIDDQIRAGRAVQRFWLTATSLGLMVQPELTPLIFARYADEQRVFSATPGAADVAVRVSARLKQLAGQNVTSHGVFLGRIGHARPPVSRSLRLSVAALRSPR